MFRELHWTSGHPNLWVTASLPPKDTIIAVQVSATNGVPAKCLYKFSLCWLRQRLDLRRQQGRGCRVFRLEQKLWHQVGIFLTSGYNLLTRSLKDGRYHQPTGRPALHL
jgi:hypothetical protein